MTSTEKLGYLLPPHVRGSLALELLLPLTKLFQSVKGSVATEVVLVWFILAIILGLRGILCAFEIGVSVRRVRRRLRAGYAPPLG